MPKNVYELAVGPDCYVLYFKGRPLWTEVCCSEKTAKERQEYHKINSGIEPIVIPINNIIV